MTAAEESLAAMSKAVLGMAGRAPSLHNSQPWRFRVAASSIDLLLDRSRLMPAVDPTSRESVISCGAALYNLRLAVAGIGFEPVVRLLPDRDDPTHLATVALGHPRSATREEQEMLAAVPRRHTHRGAFLPREVDRGLLVRLQEAAAGEGATLHLIETPGARASIGRLLVTADRTQRADPAYRQELAAWTPEPGSLRRDGVPATAYPLAPEGVVPEEFPGRDFSLGRGYGVPREEVGDEAGDAAGGAVDATGDDGEGAGPAVATLTTAGDRPIDWLRAGQALEHVLLLASVQWVYAWFGTSPVEVPAIRMLLRGEIGTAAFPQMLMRLGHADIAPSTPRRPVTDTLATGRERRT